MKRTKPMAWENLYDALQQELAGIRSSETSSIRMAQQSVQSCMNYLESLKSQFVQSGTVNKTEEIQFFKVIKPMFQGQLLYYVDIHYLEQQKPISRRAQESYLLKEYDRIGDPCLRHGDFYIYYRAGLDELDEIYFLRKPLKAIQRMLLAEKDGDPAFSTGYDYLVARLKANELFGKYLQESIHRLQENADEGKNKSDQPVIPWKAPAIALAEVVIAFHASNAFGDAKWTLNRIAGVFSSIFGVKLTNMSKMREEISLRRHRTSFVDLMKTSLLHDLEESDEHRL